MQKKLILSFFIILIMAGCDTSKSPENNTLIETPCNNQSVQDIEWLNELISDARKNQRGRIEVYKCLYDTTEGFLVDICVQCADDLGYYYDCNGNRICEFGGIAGLNTCPDFEDKLYAIELVFVDSTFN